MQYGLDWIDTTQFNPIRFIINDINPITLCHLQLLQQIPGFNLGSSYQLLDEPFKTRDLIISWVPIRCSRSSLTLVIKTSTRAVASEF
ncbi:uncharacterized protein EAE98_011111 [Botrytis deweyae]|uniref:Uncharacterized protein n=1 Tax=Botrytis deweyae TaxID=2478750 RepID=A0ABQ7I717_9HELO|nr:uncharacterized protein EAE98_011111 [Botrytis deweyae]KAF7915508.1 hypothetical protein EAE98_011111 [Botrytis deweyae]